MCHFLPGKQLECEIIAGVGRLGRRLRAGVGLQQQHALCVSSELWVEGSI